MGQTWSNMMFLFFKGARWKVFTEISIFETIRSFYLLTHFMPLDSFYTSWKHQKTSVFLFSAVYKETSDMNWVNWHWILKFIGKSEHMSWQKNSNSISMHDIFPYFIKCAALNIIAGNDISLHCARWRLLTDLKQVQPTFLEPERYICPTSGTISFTLVACCVEANIKTSYKIPCLPFCIKLTLFNLVNVSVVENSVQTKLIIWYQQKRQGVSQDTRYSMILSSLVNFKKSEKRCMALVCQSKKGSCKSNIELASIVAKIENHICPRYGRK